MNTGSQVKQEWKYELVYTYQGKDYNRSEVFPTKAGDNQYEVIAYGWLLADAEHYAFSQDEVLSNVALLEIGEDGVRKPVWAKNLYPVKILR